MNNNKLFKQLFFVLAILLIGLNTKAQDLLKVKDISTIKVDLLTDDEILQYKQQLSQTGLTEQQAEQLAIQRGFPATEVIKLRARLSKLEFNNSATTKPLESKPIKQVQQARIVDSTGFDKSVKKINERKYADYIFGSDLFNNENTTFEPNLRIPTPKNYTIGPDDELIVDVFGYQEVNQKLTVNPEGNISIPNVGSINVNGISVENATKRIRERMIRSGYASIGTGQSQLQVSIGKIRSIKVIVIGQAQKAGTYTLSSLSSLFHALYAAGGPNEKGSLRQIEVVRNNKIIEVFDAYKFLTNGDQGSDIRLMDRDVVRIPVAKILVTVSGQINKPAVYEVLPKESLSDLIQYAGGFASGAYTASIQVIQMADKEKNIKDVAKNSFGQYKPMNGDVIEIGKILDKFTNRISIKGAVYRPGQYELVDGITLSQLIAKADGLKEDVFKERGVIVRMKDDFSKEVLSFNPISIINKKQADIILQKNDEITIGSSADFTDKYTIDIVGQIRKPGQYPYYENESLKDILFEAGGFTDGSLIDKIEIARRIDLGKDGKLDNQIAEVITVDAEKDLTLSNNDVKLKAWDIITVKTKPGYKPQIRVRIEGEVQYPGTYILASKEDKVSGLLKRAGGLTPSAFIQGVNIIRLNNTNILKDTSDIYFKKLQLQTKDTSALAVASYISPTVKIGLDIEKILKDTSGNENIYLQEGDVITVPKLKREIKISGEVLFPTEVVFFKGERVNYYIDKAGGFTDDAKKGKIYVLKPNGVAAKTKHFLFFRNYPEVLPGSEILVPKIAIKKKASTAETLAMTTGIASLAGVIVAIINLVKK